VAYVVGGVGVVALAGFVYFNRVSWSDYRSLSSSCGTTHDCAPSDITAVKAKIAMSAVGLGVGVVAVAVSAWLLLTAPSRPAARATTSLRARTVLGVGGAGLAGAF
jgi:hypothetical protein